MEQAQLYHGGFEVCEESADRNYVSIYRHLDISKELGCWKR